MEANFVPAPAGPAYVDDNGTLRAGVSIWAWRDFLRRSATMQHTIARSAGKPTVLYIHMTNVNMIPLLSWASVNLDWEWRDQGGQAEMDVQTRNAIGCNDQGMQCNDTSCVLNAMESFRLPAMRDSSCSLYQCSLNCSMRSQVHLGANCRAAVG